MDTNKIVVLVVWVACIVAMNASLGWISTIGAGMFWLMLIAHVVEFVIKKSVMEKAGGSLGQHFAQTLLFGMFHWKPLEEAQASSSE